MLTTKELLERAARTQKLLENPDVPPQEKLRAAKLRALDLMQAGLQQKHPELEKEGNA